MKTTLFCLFFSALSLCAAQYKVLLPASPGTEQVYFLDLDGLGADSASFKLTTPEGKDVPFSFDMRLVSPGFKVKNPDGYRTWAAIPAAKNAILKPGWLSFKGVPGVKEYVFTFRDGAAKTVDRPDPAVRAWWIELSKNPGCKDLKQLYFDAKQVTRLPDGHLKTTGLIRFRPRGFNLDPRGTGRRILGYMRLKSTKGRYNFSVQYRNEAYRQAAALNPNVVLPANELTDVCVEGVVCKDPAQTIRTKGYPVWISPGTGNTIELYDFRVQLPPAEQQLGIALSSDILNSEDVLTLSPSGLRSENLLPFAAGKIKGVRVGTVSGKITISSRLLTSGGKCAAAGTNKLVLKKIKPGKYTLEAALYADGVLLTKQSFPVTVQQGPF